MPEAWEVEEEEEVGDCADCCEVAALVCIDCEESLPTELFCTFSANAFGSPDLPGAMLDTPLRFVWRPEIPAWYWDGSGGSECFPTGTRYVYPLPPNTDCDFGHAAALRLACVTFSEAPFNRFCFQSLVLNVLGNSFGSNPPQLTVHSCSPVDFDTENTDTGVGPAGTLTVTE